MSDAGHGDRELLQQFTHGGSHEAFAQIVERYVDLVYATCFRDLRDHHLAEDATQAVFIVLARKAHSLRGEVVLAGWLYQTARLVVRNVRKQEARRKSREYRAAQMTRQTAPATLTFDGMSPLLGDGLDRLAAKDREAILLHYFQRKSHAEIGTALGVSEDAARMRVTRALDKLREFFRRKGHTMAVTAVTTLLMAHSVQAAPPSCASAIVAAVCPLAGKAAVAASVGVSGSASASALANATMKTMFLAKAKVAAAIVAATLLVPTAGMATYHALARQNDVRAPVAVAASGGDAQPELPRVREAINAKPASVPAEPSRPRTHSQQVSSKTRVSSDDTIRFHAENGLLIVSAPPTAAEGKPIRMSPRGVLGETRVTRTSTRLNIENRRSTTDGGIIKTRIAYEPGVSLLIERTIKPRAGKEYASVVRQSHRGDPGKSLTAGQMTLQVTSDGGENWGSWAADDFRRFTENYPLAYLAHVAPVFRDFTSRKLCFLPINAARQVLIEKAPTEQTPAVRPDASSRPLADVLGGEGTAGLVWRREIEMLQGDVAFLIDCLECDELDVRKAALHRLNERLGKPIALDINEPPEKRRASAAALRRILGATTATE